MVVVVLSWTLAEFFIARLRPGKGILKSSHPHPRNPSFEACLARRRLILFDPMRHWCRVLGVVFLILPLAFSVAWAQPIEKKNRIMFSNIAPGELESELIRKFPAKIIFTSESGAPYAGVYARVFNASGVAIFKHLCEKPWLFLNLPAGDYHVVGVDRKKVTQFKPFRVHPGEGRQTVVKLTWPASAVGY